MASCDQTTSKAPAGSGMFSNTPCTTRMRSPKPFWRLRWRLVSFCTSEMFRQTAEPPFSPTTLRMAPP